jgi:hypothetical protein
LPLAERPANLNEAGLIVITAFISPYRDDHDAAKRIIGEQRFLEVFLDAPLEVCEARDPKGLYRKARAGEVSEFTGISAPYERPEYPDMVAADRFPRCLAGCRGSDGEAGSRVFHQLTERPFIILALSSAQVNFRRQGEQRWQIRETGHR